MNAKILLQSVKSYFMSTDIFMDMGMEFFFLWWYGFLVLDMKKKFASDMDKFWLDIGEFFF